MEVSRNMKKENREKSFYPVKENQICPDMKYITLENVLTDTDSEDTMLEKMALRQSISELPEREALVIQLRYFHGLTQERISRVLGVSQVQVSRIEKKALARLRDMMA